MSLDEIKNMFFIQCYLLNHEIEDIVSSIQTPKNFLYFMARINVLLESNNYLLFLDNEELLKVKAIIEQLIFKYSSANYIKNYQRNLYHKLCVMERDFAKSKNMIIKNTLEEERKVRCLPEDIEFGVDTLLEFYKKDFDNYKLLLYPEHNYKKIDFVSFFSTVNKMCSLNSFVFEDSNLRIGFKIALMHFEILCENDSLVEYSSDTLARIEQNKVYRFPGLSN